ETVECINENLAKDKIKEIPVIFITGYADDGIKVDAKALKPIAYIYKPFDIPELIDKVKEVLK
ncbi:MAG: hybrid sensor histidine kinase/response regulator, partial [Deltaproteobacteria bacterium]